MFANANHANQEFAELRLDPDDFSCYLLIFVGPPSATGWHGTLCKAHSDSDSDSKSLIFGEKSKTGGEAFENANFRHFSNKKIN